MRKQEGSGDLQLAVVWPCGRPFEGDGSRPRSQPAGVAAARFPFAVQGSAGITEYFLLSSLLSSQVEATEAEEAFT